LRDGLGALGIECFSPKWLSVEGLEGRLLYWGNGGLWRQASLFMGAQLGKPGVGLSTRNFERWLKGALEVGRLSQWELSEGNLEGGLP